LERLRLAEAARLLAEKDMAAVAQIAYFVRFSNISCFAKLFKVAYGCAPKAFRGACPWQRCPGPDNTIIIIPSKISFC
jgi:AraC-like DNA-binding protein